MSRIPETPKQGLEQILQHPFIPIAAAISILVLLYLGLMNLAGSLF